MALKERHARRWLSRRLRFLGLTSHEQVELRKLKRFYFLLEFMINEASKRGDLQDAHKLRECQHLCEIRYISIKYTSEDRFVVPPLVNWQRTIASFDETVCDQQFRFLRNHLTLLCELLHFPEWVIFDNRSKMLGEEVFLRGLYEIRSGSTQFDCAANLFGREASAQSRAYTWFINHIYSRFKHLVTNNLDWWYRNGFMDQSKDAIWNKMIEVNAILCERIVFLSFILLLDMSRACNESKFSWCRVLHRQQLLGIRTEFPVST